MKLKYIFSVLLVILVSGCIGGSSDTKSPVIQGNSGLEFEIQNIPDSIRTNTNLDFTVSATNYGGYTVPSEKIRIQLANTIFFEILELNEDIDQKVDGEVLTNSIPLNKRVPELDRGDTIYFDYDNVLFNLPAVPGDSTVLSLNACYYYQTDGLADICISDDSYGEICNAVEEKESFSSAGPVKITNVKQLNSLRIGPSTLSNILSTISFDIKYIGDGSVGSSTNDFNCDNSDLSPNSVRLNSIKFGSQSVEDIADSCGGSELIYLDENGEAKVTCSLLTYAGWTTQLGEFEERMTISLDYVHNNIVSKSLSII